MGENQACSVLSSIVNNDLLYKVAYDEALRALSEQQAVIDSFRNRAGLLFSSAAIAASFLGSQALRGSNPNLAAWLALLCFVAVAGASLIQASSGLLTLEVILWMIALVFTL